MDNLQERWAGGRSSKQRLRWIEKPSMRSLSPDQTTRIITTYYSLKGNLQLTVYELIWADIFNFYSAREIPQLQEDMISEETNTKFSLPKSRKDFSHLIRGELQKSKSYRDNFKRYIKKKYLLFQFLFSIVAKAWGLPVKFPWMTSILEKQNMFKSSHNRRISISY